MTPPTLKTSQHYRFDTASGSPISTQYPTNSSYKTLFQNSKYGARAQAHTPRAATLARPQPQSRSPSTLLLDGSDKDANMTFGWALSMGHDQHITTCSGPAHGKSSSHQAEATGMLSGSSFIHRLSQYSGLIPNRLDLFSDNKGLLTRVQARNKYTTNHPNATIAPDWDLIDQFHSTLEETNALFPTLSTHIAHVKGHRDDHILYDELSLEAQLNVDTDATTGTHHYHAKYKCSKASPLLPATKVQLYIGQETITSHYRSAIRQAASITLFWLQTQRIHQWTPGILVRINKDHVRASVCANCHQHKFIFKWLHHLLPTQEVHDQQHFLRCTAPTVAKWRTPFLGSLRRWMDTNENNLVLLTIFNDVISAWLNQTTIQPHNYPPQYRPALNRPNSNWLGGIPMRILVPQVGIATSTTPYSGSKDRPPSDRPTVGKPLHQRNLATDSHRLERAQRLYTRA
jgi:hypothetical protein